jgi:hypothetical protein
MAFLRATFVALLVSGLALWAAYQNGVSTAATIPTIFTNAGGTPCHKICVFGAQVGMPIDDAVNHIQNHPATVDLVLRDIDGAIYFFRGGQRQTTPLITLVKGSGKRVISIFVSTFDSKDLWALPAKLFLMLWGKPEFVNVGSNGDVILTYAQQGFSIMVPAQTAWLDGAIQIGYIEITASEISASLGRFPGSVWKGFTCLNRYVRADGHC